MATGSLMRAYKQLAEPAGRHVFYNHCSFDGNKAAADADDDSAVASTALKVIAAP